MSDISKCFGENCPLALTCYRYTSPASEFWQAYGQFTYNEETKNCEWFWDNKNEYTIKELKNGN